MKSPADDHIWFIDIQTTGTSPSVDAITEIAWTPLVSIRDFVGNSALPAVFSRRVRLPDEFALNQKISRRIAKLSGQQLPELLKNLESGLTPKEIWEEIEESHSQAQLDPKLRQCGLDPHCVIHFAQFEMLFQKQLTGKDSFPYPVLCTFKLAQILLPELQSKSLRSVAGRFGHPTREFKQAQNHIEATLHLFRSLLNNSFLGAETRLESILRLFTERKLEGHARRRAPQVSHAQTSLISHAARLKISEGPGIYRFVGPGHTTLYIGKATSLKSRVNSYFRGKKSKGSRLSEMLVQAHAIGTLELESVVHASVLETMLIAQLDPPYNRALRERNKSPGYLLVNPEKQEYVALSSSELEALRMSEQDVPKQNIRKCYGPYPNAKALKEKLAFLKAAFFEAQTDALQEQAFFSQESVREGAKLFFAEFGLNNTMASQKLPGIARRLLGEKLKQERNSNDAREDLDTQQSPARETSKTKSIADDGATCCAWIKGILKSLLSEAIRGKRLEILGHASIVYREREKEHSIETRNGRINFEASAMRTTDPVLCQFRDLLQANHGLTAKHVSQGFATGESRPLAPCSINNQESNFVFNLDTYNACTALLTELLRQQGSQSTHAPLFCYLQEQSSKKIWLPGAFLSPLWRSACKDKPH